MPTLVEVAADKRATDEMEADKAAMDKWCEAAMDLTDDG